MEDTCCTMARRGAGRGAESTGSVVMTTGPARRLPSAWARAVTAMRSRQPTSSAVGEYVRSWLMATYSSSSYVRLSLLPVRGWRCCCGLLPFCTAPADDDDDEGCSGGDFWSSSPRDSASRGRAPWRG